MKDLTKNQRDDEKLTIADMKTSDLMQVTH